MNEYINSKKINVLSKKMKNIESNAFNPMNDFSSIQRNIFMNLKIIFLKLIWKEFLL